METFICPEPNCGKKFSRRFNLNRHYQNFHINTELVEKCLLCGQIFANCQQMQQHYKRFHRPSRRFFIKESAFKKAFITYRYNYHENPVNFSTAQMSIKNLIKQRILSETVEKTICKISLVFIAEMSMYDHAGEKMHSIPIPFRASAFLANGNYTRNISKHITSSFNQQAEHLEDFVNSGSNWQFERPIAFDIEIGAIKPIVAGQADFEKPINMKNIINHKFLYNPSNRDQKCFLYCICKHLYDSKLNKNKKQSEEKQLRKYFKKFNTKKIDFPISLSNIKRFLKQNKEFNLKLNILYRNTENKIFPLEYGLGEGTNIATLLMVQTKTSHHFLLVENVNKFLRTSYKTGENNKSYKKEHFCLNCLNSFSSETILAKHEKLCCVNKPRLEITPENNKIIFKNIERQHKQEYIAYADFECCLPSVENYCEVCSHLKCKCDASFTDVINKQNPIAFSFIVLGPDKKILHEKSFCGDDAGKHFVGHLLDIEEDWLKQLLSINVAMKMTPEDILSHENASQCYLCKETFSDDIIKCRDHSHATGHYLGAACQQCNLRRRKPRTLKVLIHNGSRYDFHFIVKSLGDFGDRVHNINVLPYNGENFRTLSFNCFEFVDSLAFLQAPLMQLSSDLKDTTHDYKILKQTFLVQTNDKFDNEKFNMVLGKSFFPYEYCTSLKQMRQVKKIPRKKHFYSVLTEKTISKTDHNFAKQVWKKFKCKDLLDYTRIYCKIDTVLLAEIFEKFRDDMINFSGLDPSHYISLPAYSYDSMLKITQSVIELPTDINIIHFIESAKRGGVAMIGTRHLQEKSGKTDEIVYVDANNLYGYAQMAKLPIDGFKWLTETEIDNFDINNIDLDGDTGFMIECDLEYPEKLHKKHNNLPLAPEILEISYDALSPYAKKALLDSDNQTKYKDVKLMATFNDRIEYVVHGKNLKLYLDLGLKLKQIHRILKFRQDNFIAPYIMKCTEARQKSSTKFEMDQFKKLVS